MTFTATLSRHKMASTFGGMRRLLKYKGPVPTYIRQAVETGIYRTNEELAAVWKERKHSSDDLASIMKRFRQDIVRGSNVQDYPIEYLILRQHPPIPNPPRVPKRIVDKMREAPNATEKLVEKYLTKHEKAQRRERAAAQTQANHHHDHNDGAPKSTQEYYRRLLGVAAPPPTSSMGQKPAAVQKAYAAAIKQYQLQRTQGLSEADAMRQVDELLQSQNQRERAESKRMAQALREFRANRPHDSVANIDVTRVVSKSANDNDNDEGDTATASSNTTLEQSLQSIFKANPRTLEGMMKWSERLQAVPYLEWTVGASTALDHWIARRLLNISEETWSALLEGEDPDLLSRGRDIVAVRESLFPETALSVESESTEDVLDDEDDEEPLSDDKSIEELLAALGGLKTNRSGRDAPARQPGWLSERDASEDVDAKVESLVKQLQDWRRQNVHTPYAEWSETEKERFNDWMKEYIDTISSDAEKRNVDWKSTREALLSQPPMTAEESERFWDSLGDEESAADLLASMLADGPPVGANILHSAFWQLPYEDQLERLLNLGAIRPLMDEYTRESDRNKFLQRYGDTLLKGVVMEHLVPDPDGPVQISDLAEGFGLSRDSRFRLEMKAYQSTEDLPSDERTRAMFLAWNTHKSGRARYEEKLFKTGRLGLTYNERIYKDDEVRPDDDEE
ncbi:hypothetical protein MPSEU_000323800 [Mayamaea pseudoterrestris]|nr:hypothetical protein MPSEU_000323800 [Mayamaea pseudoterrestris]